MKRLGKKREGDISPDLTSFSDIANLLIIFFILTTSLVRPFGRPMEMPSSAKPPEQQASDTPTVRITLDRLVFSEGEKKERELSMNELRQELWGRNFPAKPADKRSVVVETAEDVPYARYYQVATAIAAAGGVVAVMTE